MKIYIAASVVSVEFPNKEPIVFRDATTLRNFVTGLIDALHKVWPNSDIQGVNL